MAKASKTLDQAQHPQNFQAGDKPEQKSEDHHKAGIVKEIIQKNREALQKMEDEAANQDFTQEDMMKGLEELADEGKEAEAQEAAQEPELTEGSDAAPVSPFADAPTPEELKRQAEKEREEQFLQAVKAVSSASEDEAASGTEAGGRRMKAKITPSSLAVVKESSSQSAKRKKQYYKGMPVMSDTEEGASPRRETPAAPNQKTLPPQEADDGSGSRSSHGSADEYFSA